MVKTRLQCAAGAAESTTSGVSANSSLRSAATARAEIAEVEAEHARRLAALTAQQLSQERVVVEAERQAKLAAIEAKSIAGSRASSFRASRSFSHSGHVASTSVEKWLDINNTLSPNIQKDVLCMPQVALSVHPPPLPLIQSGTLGPVAPSSPLTADHGPVNEARGLASAHIGASLQPPPLPPLPTRQPSPFEGQCGGPAAATTTDPMGLHNAYLHARVGTHKHVYNTNKFLEPQHSDINLLAEAIKRLAHQPAPRRVSDLPLPTYTGTPTEWLNFQRQYERSKIYFDDVENLTRISLALKGVAREAVASLLISADSPECVMSALQCQFGNPEVIVLQVVREVRALPRLNSYDSGKEINAFACRIRNSIDTIRLLNFPEHLANPELVNSILAKLTPLLKEKWVEFAFSRQNTQKCKLEILSDFLIHEAEIHLRFGILSDNFNCHRMSLVKERSERVHNSIPKEIAYLSDKDANCFFSPEPNAISLNKPTTSKVDTSKSVVSNCRYCQSQTHDIANCDNFRSLSVDHRVRWVKDKKVCWRCLRKGNHFYKSCNKVCHKCKKPHHTLLHPSGTDNTYNANVVPLNDVSSTGIQLNPDANTDPQSVTDSQTVVHVAMPARECSRPLLKVIPVTVEGSKGNVDTFALLDDGSSATFIDSNVAAQIGATGPKSQVQINCVGGLAKTAVVEYVDFIIRGSRNDSLSHSLHRVRSISNLAIVRQSLRVRDINCDHLSGLQDQLCYEDAQPMLIIGIDNWHLTVPLEILQGTRSQPVACRTALGWVVFGFTRSQSKFKIDRWFAGPEFLLNSPTMWPQEPSSVPVPLALDELKCHHELVALATTSSPPESLSPVVADHLHFSQWLRLLRATARVHLCAKVFLRSLGKCLIPNPEVPNSLHSLSAADIVKAEIHLLRQSQNNFKEKIACVKRSASLPKHSRLKNFTLFIGEDDLLRLSSRILGVREISPCLDVQPTILDGHHPIVRLMLAHLHQKHAHGNAELVVNEVGSRFHVLHLRPSVKSVASRCQFCRIRKATPQVPSFGNLPQGRLAHHVRPFTHVGLDYFGPVTATVGRRHLKRYMALFTCMTVRAIYFKIVALMALRRSIARRGCPTDIYSDNATAFVGAARQLHELYDFAANQKISWHFIPPLAPFMGGCWERLVKSVKTALRITLKERSPKEEVLQTFLLEAEATINSRPLTHVAVGVDDDEALAPFHFLLGGPPGDRPLQPLSDADLCRRQDYKKGLRLADHFWQRWTREVLPCLVLRRPGSHHNDSQIKCGDIVLIVDGSLPRSSWPRGRVVRTYPGRDGRIRTVDVATKGGTLKRAVRLLVPLAVD